MCIIIHKPSHATLPETVVRNAFGNNPHGAGYAVRLPDGKIMIHKGFWTADDLLADIDGRAGELLIHCRIATAGIVDDGNCHPFPLTWNTKRLRAMDTTATAAIAHNGMMDYGDPKELTIYSDTLLLVRDVLSHVYRGNRDAFDNTLDAVAQMTGGRFAVMDADGVTLYGRGWTATPSGCHVSNRSYLPNYYNHVWKPDDDRLLTDGDDWPLHCDICDTPIDDDADTVGDCLLCPSCAHLFAYADV